MYICICNCLKEEDCRNALQKGACSALDVYEKQGCKPKCGKCVSFMEETFFGAMRSQRDASSSLST